MKISYIGRDDDDDDDDYTLISTAFMNQETTVYGKKIVSR